MAAAIKTKENVILSTTNTIQKVFFKKVLPFSPVRQLPALFVFPFAPLLHEALPRVADGRALDAPPVEAEDGPGRGPQGATGGLHPAVADGVERGLNERQDRIFCVQMAFFFTHQVARAPAPFSCTVHCRIAEKNYLFLENRNL